MRQVPPPLAVLSGLPMQGRARRGPWAGRVQTVLGLLLILTGITGLAYPLLVTMLAHRSVPAQVQGGPVLQDGTDFTDGRRFEPSATPEGAAAAAPSLRRLRGPQAPADLVTASAGRP